MVQPILWAVYQAYLSKPRWYRYDGLYIRILPSVFHPGLFFSTKVLLKFVLNQELKNKRVLELGAGSGLIALACSKAGAIVTATDINPAAIMSMHESSDKNKLRLDVILSYLFEKIPNQVFDYILINPPYYPKQPNSDLELAFYCGQNFEYFRELFRQLSAFRKAETKVYLILSQDCAVEIIFDIAGKSGFKMKETYSHSRMGEKQYIYLVEFI